MKRISIFLILLVITTFVLGLLVTQSQSESGSTLTPKDEAYRARLATINSRPLGDGILAEPDSGFPFDNGYIKENDTVEGLGSYTSPTNIGLYLTYMLGVYQGIIQPFYDFPKDKALERIKTTLTTLDSLPPEDKWRGLYYWMVYENGKWVRAADGRDNYVISQPDNGNLFAALITVLGGAEIALENTVDTAERRKLLKVKELTTKLIEAADWKGLIDPERELYYLAYIPDTGQPLRFGGDHVGGHQGAPIYVENLMDEWRLGVLVAYAMGDMPGGSSKDIPSTTWTGLDREKRAFPVGSGHIEALASGHGGMFQQRLPLIFIPERKWSKIFEEHHDNFFHIAVNFTQNLQQPFLLSAATNPEGKVEYIPLEGNPKYAVDTTYDEFGTKPLALKTDEEFNIVTYEGDRPVGDVTTFYYASTPHALALGFLTHPKEVIALFKKAELRLKAFTFPGGVPDAFGVKEGKPDLISYRTLVLDQLMFVLSLQGEAFHDDFEKGLKSLGIFEKARRLYEDEEKFYPKLYPLKRDEFPEIDTDTSIYLGAGLRDYSTAIKLTRKLAIDSGFKILSEPSEQLVAGKFVEKKIDRKDIKNFFEGNLLGITRGEHGSFKPVSSLDGIRLIKGAGWIGDRIPLVDMRGIKALVLEVTPLKKDARLVIEFKDRNDEPLFKEKKIRVDIPAGSSKVKISLSKPKSEYLAYIMLADPSQTMEVKSLRILQ